MEFIGFVYAVSTQQSVDSRLGNLSAIHLRTCVSDLNWIKFY